MSQEKRTQESGLEITYEVKRTFLYLLLFCSLCLSAPLANAQIGGVDIAIGLGTVHDKATGSGVDANSLLSCSPATDSSCALTSHLAGVMLGFSGNYMLTKRFGVGAEVSFQPSKQNYAVLSEASATTVGENLQSRITFYDFNGIYQPVKSKRAALQLSGGFGGTNLKFYDNISASNALTGSINSSSFLTSANHFQLHGGIAVPIYVKDHFFIRPQFDVRYVPNFTQYGSDLVTQAMVWVGYSFGGQ
jgi:hypothetical protein